MGPTPNWIESPAYYGGLDPTRPSRGGRNPRMRPLPRRKKKGGGWAPGPPLSGPGAAPLPPPPFFQQAAAALLPGGGGLATLLGMPELEERREENQKALQLLLNATASPSEYRAKVMTKKDWEKENKKKARFDRVAADIADETANPLRRARKKTFTRPETYAQLEADISLSQTLGERREKAAQFVGKRANKSLLRGQALYAPPRGDVESGDLYILGSPIVNTKGGIAFQEDKRSKEARQNAPAVYDPMGGLLNQGLAPEKPPKLRGVELTRKEQKQFDRAVKKFGKRFDDLIFKGIESGKGVQGSIKWAIEKIEGSKSRPDPHVVAAHNKQAIERSIRADIAAEENRKATDKVLTPSAGERIDKMPLPLKIPLGLGHKYVQETGESIGEIGQQKGITSKLNEALEVLTEPGVRTFLPGATKWAAKQGLSTSAQDKELAKEPYKWTDALDLLVAGGPAKTVAGRAISGARAGDAQAAKRGASVSTMFERGRVAGTAGFVPAGKKASATKLAQAPKADTTVSQIRKSFKDREVRLAKEAQGQAVKRGEGVAARVRGVIDTPANFLASRGPAGRRLANRLLLTEDLSTRISGHTYRLFKSVDDKLNDVQFASIEKATEQGRKLTGELGRHQSVLNRIKKEFLAAGKLERRHLKGKKNYTFQRYDTAQLRDLARKDEEILAAANNLVKEGKAVSVDDALQYMSTVPKQFTGAKFGSFELQRKLGKGITDKEAARQYIQNASRTIAQDTFWGSSAGKQANLLGQLTKQSGYKSTQRAERAINRAIGNDAAVAPGAEALSGVRQAIAASHLQRGSLANVTQPVNTAAKYGILNTGKAQLRAAKAVAQNRFTKGVSDDLDYLLKTGVASEAEIARVQRAFGAEMGGWGGKGAVKLRGFITAPGFKHTEQLNRWGAALAARDSAQALAKKAAGGSARAKRELARRGFDAESIAKRGKLEGEELFQAAREGERSTQFLLSGAELPLAATTPLGRTLTQFKTFPYKQTEFTGKELLGNIRNNPLAIPRFIATGAPAGALSKAARARLVPGSQPEEEQPIGERLLTGLEQVGAGGLPLQMYRGLVDPYKGIEDEMRLSTIGGPATGTVVDLYQAAKELSEGKGAKGKTKNLSRLIPLVGPYVKGKFSEETKSEKEKIVDKVEEAHDKLARAGFAPGGEVNLTKKQKEIIADAIQGGKMGKGGGTLDDEYANKLLEEYPEGPEREAARRALGLYISAIQSVRPKAKEKQTLDRKFQRHEVGPLGYEIQNNRIKNGLVTESINLKSGYSPTDVSDFVNRTSNDEKERLLRKIWDRANNKKLSKKARQTAAREYRDLYRAWQELLDKQAMGGDTNLNTPFELRAASQEAMDTRIKSQFSDFAVDAAAAYPDELEAVSKTNKAQLQASIQAAINLTQQRVAQGTLSESYGKSTIRRLERAKTGDFGSSSSRGGGGRRGGKRGGRRGGRGRSSSRSIRIPSARTRKPPMLPRKPSIKKKKKGKSILEIMTEAGKKDTASFEKTLAQITKKRKPARL